MYWKPGIGIFLPRFLPNFVMDSGEAKVESHASSEKHDPAKPHCFMTHCLLNPEASRTNMSEETVSACMCPTRHMSH